MALDLGGPLLPFLGLGFIPGHCSLMLATESWKWEKLFLFSKSICSLETNFSEKRENQNHSQRIKLTPSKPVF